MKFSTFTYLFSKLWPLELLWVFLVFAGGLGIGWWLWARAFHARSRRVQIELAEMEREASRMEARSGQMLAVEQAALGAPGVQAPIRAVPEASSSAPNLQNLPADPLPAVAEIPTMPAVQGGESAEAVSGTVPEELAVSPPSTLNYQLLFETTRRSEESHATLVSQLEGMSTRLQENCDALVALQGLQGTAAEHLSGAHRDLEIGLSSLGSELEGQPVIPEAFTSAASIVGSELARHLEVTGKAMHQAKILRDQLDEQDHHLKNLISNLSTTRTGADAVGVELGKIASWSENRTDLESISAEHFSKASMRLAELENQAFEVNQQLGGIEHQLTRHGESREVVDRCLHDLRGLVEEADRGVLEHGSRLGSLCQQLPEGELAERLLATSGRISSSSLPLGEAGLAVGQTLLSHRDEWIKTFQAREQFQTTTGQNGDAGRALTEGIEALFGQPVRSDLQEWGKQAQASGLPSVGLTEHASSTREIETWMEWIRERRSGLQPRPEHVNAPGEPFIASVLHPNPTNEGQELPQNSPLPPPLPPAPVATAVSSPPPLANLAAQRMGHLEAELGRLRAHHGSLLNSEREKIEALRSELAAAQVGAQTESADDENRQLRVSLEERQRELLRAKSTLEDERQRIRSLEQSLQAAKMEAAGPGGVAVLQAELEDVRMRAAEKEARASQEAVDLRGRIMELEVAIGKNKNLESQLLNQRTEISNLGARAEELQAAMQRGEEALASRDSLVQQLQSNLVNDEAVRSEGRERIVALEAQLTSLHTRLAEIDRLQIKLGEAESYATQREAEVVDLRHQLSELHGQLGEAQMHGERLVAQREERVEDNLARIAELEELLGDRSREQARLAAELTASQEIVGELEAQVEQAIVPTGEQEQIPQVDVAALQEMERLHTRIAELEWLLEEKTAEREEAVAKLSSAEFHLQEGEGLTHQHESLRDDLDLAREDAEALRSRISQLDRILAERDLHLEEAHARVQFLEPIVGDMDSLVAQKDLHEAELDGLRGRISELEQLRIDAENEVAQLRTELDGVAESGNAEPRLREMEGECDRLRTALEGVGVIREEVEALRAELAIESGRSAEMQAQLRGEAEANASVTGMLQKELAGARTSLRECEEELVGLRLELRGQIGSSTVPAPSSAVVPILAVTEPSVPLADQPQAKEMAEVERLGVANADAWQFPKGGLIDAEYGLIYNAPPGGRDDLELIKGVEPLIHEKLNAMGIYLFAQVGSWETPQVAAFAGIFGDRIECDAWIVQAQQFHQAKYDRGEKLAEWEN